MARFTAAHTAGLRVESLKPFDVAVIGAGPAGAMAALKLAGSGLAVALLDAQKLPRTKPCAGWLNRRGAQLLEQQTGIALDEDLARPIHDVSFFSADLSKRIEPNFDEAPGFLVERSRFDSFLVEQAAQAGATVLDGHEISNVTSDEAGLTLHAASGQAVAARFLVVSTGRRRELLASVGVHTPSQAATWSVHVEQAIAKSTPIPEGNRLFLILGLAPPEGLCIAVQSADRVAVTLSGRHDPRALPAILSEVCGRLTAGGHLGVDLSAAAANACAMPTFPFSALEMDSHVGKHSLVIGDAGGFLASPSHEGTFPAMWSACIAADVITEARDSAVPQDTLMQFDSKWRIELGDYLRPPNVDLQLLLPLVFSNQGMADRLASALLAGENF